MYDYFLGGKDNFAVDREAAEQVLELVPQIPYLARANRAFLRRALRFLISEGIDQYIDLGTGIPTQGNVNEIVLDAIPDAGIMYVDIDPVVCAHARALTGDRVQVHQADLRDPDAVLAAARQTLDLDRPVGLIAVAVMHFVTDDQEAGAIMAAYRAALAPGSFLVLTHGTDESLDRDTKEGSVGVYEKSTSPVHLRSTAEVARLFEGFTLVEPGVVDLAAWRPDAETHQLDGVYGLGGVGRR
ncbi:hypothetical protein DPM19_19005 [Actinomadura craniellae]|uniref:SAM-dependent methyltransferase n=2 Tax=Actinomadura craniellae TaxID=2231787 RepID=A0A365H3Q8_9ACTN|nr:hypothetical protein DPM19_19005 [Actinomadura craniellae]